MSGHALFRILLLAGVVAPLVVTSTPPSPPPPWVYRIRGVVMDPRGDGLAGLAVALAGRCHGDTLVLLRPGRTDCGYVYPERGIPATLTDENGTFYLDVFTSAWMDSLAVAVVLDGGFRHGDLFARSSHRHAYELEESIPRENEGYMCSDTIEYENDVVGYVLAFVPDTLTVDLSATSP